MGLYGIDTDLIGSKLQVSQDKAIDKRVKRINAKTINTEDLMSYKTSLFAGVAETSQIEELVTV